MKTLSWVVLALCALVLVALLYYLLVGHFLFKISISRKSWRMKKMKKNFAQRMEKYRVELDWWKNFKVVSVKSFDGLTLKGRFIDLGATKTALVVHGFGQSCVEMQQYCKMFVDNGFNVLAIDCRGHGESEGKFAGMGVLDAKDILSWCEFLGEKSKIVLFGISMGGSAVCCACAEKLPQNVVAAISDSAFQSVPIQLDALLKRYRIFGKIIKKHLLSYMKRVQNFDLHAGGAVFCVKKTNIPILFIHGGADNYVAVENAKNLYASTPPQFRDKLIVDDAEHIMSIVVDKKGYERKIFEFLNARTRI